MIQRKSWDKKEVNLIKSLYSKNFSNDKIGNTLKRNNNSVKQKINALGLKGRRNIISLNNKTRYDDDFLYWLSGFIDGEGSISIFKFKKCYYARLSIANTNLNILKYIKNKLKFGGIQHQTHVHLNWKIGHHFQSNNTADLYNLFVQLKGKIILKEKQLNLALIFLKSYSNKEEKNYNKYIIKSKKLNKKGL